MQQEATCTCSECGQPEPKPPVTVTLPSNAIAVVESFDEYMANVPHAWGRASVYLRNEEPDFGYWVGPALCVEFYKPGGDTLAQARVALEENPRLGCFDGEPAGGIAIPRLAEWR